MYPSIKEKATGEGGFSKDKSVGELLNRGNSLVRDDYRNCTYSVASLGYAHQELLTNLSHNWLPMAAASGDKPCL